MVIPYSIHQSTLPPLSLCVLLSGTPTLLRLRLLGNAVLRHSPPFRHAEYSEGFLPRAGLRLLRCSSRGDRGDPQYRHSDQRHNGGRVSPLCSYPALIPTLPSPSPHPNSLPYSPSSLPPFPSFLLLFFSLLCSSPFSLCHPLFPIYHLLDNNVLCRVCYL